MEVTKLHGWQLSPSRASAIQRQLAARVSRSSQVGQPRFIAGVDLSVGKVPAMARGAVVVLSYPELKVVEVEVAEGRLVFPYIAPEISVGLSNLDPDTALLYYGYAPIVKA